MNNIQISKDLATGLNAAADRHNALIYLVENLLVEGSCIEGVGTTGDYGKIPKCGQKPVLFKQGAEKLADAFGLRIILEKTEQILEPDFVHYEFTATIFGDRIGDKLTTHIGACNTEEKGIARSLEKQGQTPRGYAHNIACRAEKRAYVGGVIKALAATQYFAWEQEAYDLLPIDDRPFEGITVEIEPQDLTEAIRDLAREICSATGCTTQQLQALASAHQLPSSSAALSWEQALELQKLALVSWVKGNYLMAIDEAMAMVEALPPGRPTNQKAILITQLGDYRGGKLAQREQPQQVGGLSID
jgi:hypothetical protein